MTNGPDQSLRPSPSPRQRPERPKIGSGEQTMSWINLAALWKIVALGLLALSRGGGRAQVAGDDSDVVVGGNPAGIVVAALCFLVVLAAIGWGIYEIYQIGHPATK